MVFALRLGRKSAPFLTRFGRKGANEMHKNCSGLETFQPREISHATRQCGNSLQHPQPVGALNGVI